MNIPRQFYGINYISRLFSNFRDGDVMDCPKLDFHEIHDIVEVPLPVKDTLSLSLSSSMLSKLLQELLENRSCMLDGLAIAKGENIVCFGYRPPYTKENPHITNSTCKTITAIALMYAVSEGLLSVQDTVLSFFPEYETVLTPKRIKHITIEHLLTMTSSSKCTEIATVVEDDWVKAFLLSDCQSEPGTKFIYNSMNTYMLSAILCKVTGMSLLEYLRPRLFEPLGINDITWELCPKGIERGGWGMHLSLEGMLKIGLFVANDGTYNGKSLIDSLYIRRMKESNVKQDVDALSTGYGYHLWHLPDGYYMLSGMYGQHVIIDEEHQLVVATNAHNDKMFPDSVLTRSIIDYMKRETLHQSDTRLREKLFYKQFMNEFQAFCNGWELPDSKGKILFSHYSKIQQKRLVNEINELKRVCNREFHGECLHIEQESFKLFPYMMRCMYQFPPFAVTDIVFRVSDNFISMCFVKEPVRKDSELEKIIIKAGFQNYVEQTISIGLNEVLVSSKVYLSRDEDDNTVMQLDIVFPAAGFSRKIKFFLLEDRVLVECIEYPDMKAIVEQVVYGETALAGNAIDLTGKLPEGVKVFLDHKVEPRVRAIWKENMT